MLDKLGRATDGTLYRRAPCSNCPWRVDQVGEFPADRYRDLAGCAYDASFKIFTCHKSERHKPVVCAGFLLRNSANNVSCRLMHIDGGTDCRTDAELHGNYREMAIANGVGPDDPVLTRCRADNE